MKLQKDTIATIKNFASINQNLMIKPGNILFTMSPNKWLYAEAKIEEDFNVDFGVYDLNELLSIHSLFSDPELAFSGDVLTISEGTMQVRFVASEPSFLIYPKKQNAFPSNPEVEFDLSAAQLSQITRSASILKAPTVSFVGDGQKLSVIVTDKKNVNANNLTLDMGTTDQTFSVNVKVEMFKMVPSDYKVMLAASRKVCKFSNGDRLYMMMWEQDSTFQS